MLRVRVDGAGISRDAGDILPLEPGDRVLDAVDELPEPPLSFPCRDASCGGCAVDVTRGASLFLPPAADERATLAGIGRGPLTRLACQLRAGSVPGEAVLARRVAATPG
jgi:ferredoxin